jgi:hypothetical protein
MPQHYNMTAQRLVAKLCNVLRHQPISDVDSLTNIVISGTGEFRFTLRTHHGGVISVTVKQEIEHRVPEQRRPKSACKDVVAERRKREHEHYLAMKERKRKRWLGEL